MRETGLKNAEARICAAIAASGLFNAAWYLESHPEVAASGMDPVLHYVRSGEKAGFQPAPDFELWSLDEKAEGNRLYNYITAPVSAPPVADTVPVVFATNSKYARYLSVAMASLIANASPRRHYTLYILYNDIDAEILTKLRAQSAENVVVKPVWIGAQAKELISKAYVSRNVSVETYFRIFIAKLLTQHKKCVYLDCDLIVNDDIANLYDTDIGDCYVAGAAELWGCKSDINRVLAVHPQPVRFYFNAGVLLINIEQFVRHRLYDAFMERINSGIKYDVWDQDILNIITAGHIYPLPLRWNFAWQNFVRREFDHFNLKTFSEYAGCFYQPSIIHYNSNYKPWTYNDGCLASLFWHYARLSPYYEWLKAHSKNGTEETLSQLAIEFPKFKTGSSITTASRRTSPEEAEGKGGERSGTAPVNAYAERSKPRNKMEAKNSVPVVFAVNELYAPFLGVALASLIKSAASDREYDIHIMYDELKPETIACLRGMTCANARITPLCVADRCEAFKKNYYPGDHQTVETYFRILVPEIFNKRQKALYLDCDLLVTRDLGELLEEDLSDSLLAAVSDIIMDKSFLGRIQNTSQKYLQYYFNAGMLLINIDNFNRGGYVARFAKLAANGVKYVCRDQDILNIICEGGVKRLPRKWNMGWAPLVGRHYSQGTSEEMKEYLAGFQEPAIIHFTGNLKPTDVNDGFFAPIFWHYARFSPYYERLKAMCKYDLSDMQKLADRGRTVDELFARV